MLIVGNMSVHWPRAKVGPVVAVSFSNLALNALADRSDLCGQGSFDLIGREYATSSQIRLRWSVVVVSKNYQAPLEVTA